MCLHKPWARSFLDDVLQINTGWGLLSMSQKRGAEVKRRKRCSPSGPPQDKDDTEPPGQVTVMGAYHWRRQRRPKDESPLTEFSRWSSWETWHGREGNHSSRQAGHGHWLGWWSRCAGIYSPCREMVMTWRLRIRHRKQRPFWELTLARCLTVCSVSLAALTRGVYYFDNISCTSPWVLQFFWVIGSANQLLG